MKARTLALAVGLTLSSGAVHAALINAGFETGDLTGWTAGPFTGGSANAQTSNTTTYSPGDWGAPHTFTPFYGNYMLVVQSGSANVWQEVSQSVALGAGDSISGVAMMDWGDYWVTGTAFIDGVKVEVRNSAGAVVATPFDMDGSDFCVTFCPPATGQAGAESAWTAWSFTAVIPDTYTLVYAVKNTNDSTGPNQTFGYFDALPEPGSLALIALGLAGLGFGVRRRNA